MSLTAQTVAPGCDGTRRQGCGESVLLAESLTRTLSTMTLNRRTVLAIAPLIAVALLGSIPPSSAAPDRSPQGQLLIVANNLSEDDNPSDLRRSPEARVLARRVLNQVPHRPDVVLLQEVVRETARRVARAFTNKTGDSYKVIKSCPLETSYIFLTKRRRLNCETGIVINSATIDVVDGGGFVKTTYAMKHAAEHVVTRKHAHALFERDDGGPQFAAMSVHWVRKTDIKGEQRQFSYQNAWAAQQADRLADRYTTASVRLMAGDFNQDRCAGEPSRNCQPLAPFYETLTGSTYDYIDAIRAIQPQGGVDLIFSTTTVLDAGVDLSYNKDTTDPKKFYSDHRFRWALVEMPTTP